MIRWYGVSVVGVFGFACLGFAALWAYHIYTGDPKVGLQFHK